jgi:hypothetical protein
VKSDHEFVRVQCYNNSNHMLEHLVYKDFHAFVPLKDKVEKRCADFKKPQDLVSKDKDLKVSSLKWMRNKNF